MAADKRQLPSEMSVTTKAIQPLLAEAYILSSHLHQQQPPPQSFICGFRERASLKQKKAIGFFPVHLMLDISGNVHNKKLNVLL